MRSRWLRIPTVLLVAFLAAVCGDPSGPDDDDDDDRELSIEIVSGDDQEALPGMPLVDELVVRVTDEDGDPVSGEVVLFAVTAGGGSVDDGEVVTNAQGISAEQWTLGNSGAQRVDASIELPGGDTASVTFNATLLPVPPIEDIDEDGFTVDEGDCDDNDDTVNPNADDSPDADFGDTNCDNVDGDVGLSIFVSTAGQDTAFCGDIDSTCRTIEAGLAQADARGLRDVLVATGTYDEALDLVDGINLYGGYSLSFQNRGNAMFPVVVTGGSGEHALNLGAEPISVVADGFDQATEIADLTFRGIDAADTLADGRGQSSYALLVRDVAPGLLTFARMRIEAGNGADGRAGSDGLDATQTRAPDAEVSGAGDELVTACNSSSRGQGSAGAVNPLSDSTTAGGEGGDGGTMDTDCGVFSLNLDARAGLKGDSATVFAPGVGEGGLGGSPCLAGEEGQAGRVQHGTAGDGGIGGDLVAGFWRADGGGNGTLGLDGGGGGGGGGAGGCDDGTDAYGAGGGGGGAGGVRAAEPGIGGAGGGGSFAIYLVAASPMFEGVQIVRGVGGGGGAGGAGATGQPGGLGGSSGLHPGGGAGGKGGDGGDGGSSGAGGGGAGGPSAAIATVSGSAPTLTGVETSGGAGGTGGAGGVGAAGLTSAPSGAPGELLGTAAF